MKNSLRPLHIDIEGKVLKWTSRAKLNTAVMNVPAYIAIGVSVLAISAFVVMSDYDLWSHADSSRNIYTAMLVCLPIIIAAGIAAFVGVKSYLDGLMRQKELKVLRADEDSLLVGRYSPYERDSAEAIDWKIINCIEAVIDDKDPASSQLYIETPYSVFRIRWENAIDWVDRETLVNACKSHAKNASLFFPDRNSGVKKLADSHTSLWLEYFAPPSKRSRRGPLAAGDKLRDDTYQIVERLGAGGQGTAYLARRLNPEVDDTATVSGDMHANVVLKEYILPLTRGTDREGEMFESLNAEAGVLSRIDHPHIVRLLDCFIDDHRGYLVLEYVEGKSLKERVREDGVPPEEFVRNIGLQVCDILAYLHGLEPPILHLDVTPDNLIMGADGWLKLVDFTVAHQLGSGATAEIVGKQHYMPPEQFCGKPGPQSDVYGLGCTMHYLLTGNDPEAMTPSNPRQLNSAVSEGIDSVVARATDPDLTQRYASAFDLKAALSSL